MSCMYTACLIVQIVPFSCLVLMITGTGVQRDFVYMMTSHDTLN